MAQLHKCGQCFEKFETEEGYLEHVCKRTDKVPTDQEHLGTKAAKVSEAALARGEARKNA